MVYLLVLEYLEYLMLVWDMDFRQRAVLSMEIREEQGLTIRRSGVFLWNSEYQEMFWILRGSHGIQFIVPKVKFILNLKHCCSNTMQPIPIHSPPNIHLLHIHTYKSKYVTTCFGTWVNGRAIYVRFMQHRVDHGSWLKHDVKGTMFHSTSHVLVLWIKLGAWILIQLLNDQIMQDFFAFLKKHLYLSGAQKKYLYMCSQGLCH